MRIVWSQPITGQYRNHDDHLPRAGALSAPVACAREATGAQMSDNADVAPDATKADQAFRALAYVCAHADEIRAALADDASGGKGLQTLERLRSALRSDGEISRPLEELHLALLRAGDALGVYGHVRSAGGLSLAGFDEGEPLEVVYRCPVGRCRRVVPGPAVNPPRCEVVGEALRWGQL
jgi:hypothetical protein